jgi:uncharacterized protein YgiM (DUF1202 family)
VVIGFLLPWASGGGKSFNGIYLFTELLKEAGKVYPLLLAVILVAPPVCSGLLVFDRLKNGYGKLRFPTLYLAGITFLPLLFLTAKSALSQVPLAGMFMSSGGGIGITLMVLGSLYLIFDNVFHLSKLKTNMHTTAWLWKPAAVGAAISVAPGIVILFSMEENLNLVLLLLCLALFVGGLVYTIKTHKAALGNRISLSRAVGAGSAATLFAALMTVILVPIIGSSFGKGGINAVGGFFSALFMVVGVFGYTISNIIAFFHGWEPATGYSFAQGESGVQPPAPQNTPQTVEGIQPQPTPVQQTWATPPPTPQTPTYAMPQPTGTVQQAVHQPAPVLIAQPVPEPIAHTPSKPLSEQLAPLFSTLKKYRVAMLAFVGVLALSYAAYAFFFKSDPVKEGKKAALTLCNCDNDYNERSLKAKRDFLQTFDASKFTTREAAQAAANQLNEPDREYLDCQQKANEKWSKLKSSYIGKGGLQTQLTMAYNQQLPLGRINFLDEHRLLDNGIAQKISALSAGEEIATEEEFEVRERASDPEWQKNIQSIDTESTEDETPGDLNPMYITGDNVNVRSEGSMSRGAVLFKLDKGASGEYVDERTDSRGEKWYQLDFNGQKGWVSSKLVSFDRDFEKNWKPAVIDDPDRFTNLREAPGDRSKIIGKVNENEEFTVLDANSDWWLVKTENDLRGYMHKSRIRMGKATSQSVRPTETAPTKKTSAPAKTIGSKTMVTDLGNGWKRFNGAWFSIEFPAAFTAKPSMKSSGSDGFDSAFFTSSDGTAEFYVFSPKGKGDAKEVEFNAATENILEDKTSKSKSKSVRWVKYSANDRSYMRVYQITKQGSKQTILGMKFKNWAVYERNKADYLAFKASLKQFAD